MEVENSNPNPGNNPDQPLKKRRSPNRLMVDDVVNDDQNQNSVIFLHPDKIAELNLFKGDVVSIRVTFLVYPLMFVGQTWKVDCCYCFGW